jgi:hypothetical protein
MRIAHVGSVFHEVSLDSESEEGRGIAVLAMGLDRLQYDVTVFASGDSAVCGALVPVAQRALRHQLIAKRHLSEGLILLALEKAFAARPAFDLIHVHAGLAAFPLMRRSPVPIMATVYESLDAPEVVRVYDEFKELALVATSLEQIRRCPDLNWQAIVPWTRSPRDSNRLPKRPGGLEEIASVYAAVYERIARAQQPRLRPSRTVPAPNQLASPV